MAFSLCFPSIAFAERIAFRSGKVIEAEIVERTSDYIKVREGSVYITYLLNKIDNIDGERIESATIISRVTRPLTGAGRGGGSSISKEFDEVFVEQSLEHFKDRDYAAFYDGMSAQARNTRFEDMVDLFSAEENILGRLVEYSKLARVPPTGSSSPPSVRSSFTYVCQFDRSDGSAILDVITENNRLKLNRFKLLSAAFLTDDAKAMLKRANDRVKARATLRTISGAFESYALRNNREYPTDVEAQLVNVRPPYLDEDFFTNCTAEAACFGYAYGHDNFTITAYNVTARPASCGPQDSRSFTISTGGNLTMDKNCTAAR